MKRSLKNSNCAMLITCLSPPILIILIVLTNFEEWSLGVFTWAMGAIVGLFSYERLNEWYVAHPTKKQSKEADWEACQNSHFPGDCPLCSAK